MGSDALSYPVVAQNPRITGIDGLRAVAILIVMVAHAGLGRLVPGGLGVTIFFFLSGYLITTLLRLERRAHGRIDLKAFYIRRALRILPPLYLTLALTVALMATGAIDIPVNGHNLLLDVAFLTNYSSLFGGFSSTPLPLWSLDVEEHFYLLFPAFFIVIGRLDGRRQRSILLAICVVVLAMRFATYPTHHKELIYYWTHTRIDSIVAGAVLAVWQNPFCDRGAWVPRRPAIAGALALLLLTLILRGDYFRETIRYTLQGGALFVLFSAAVQAGGVVSRVLNGRALKVVALLSYSLYLGHFPLLSACARLGPAVAPIVAYALAFAWAVLLYFAVERPLADWRKRSLAKSLAAADRQPAEGASSG